MDLTVYSVDQCLADIDKEHPTSLLLTFVFLCFALGRNLFLFQGLSLGMLPPPAQLEVDKFPHHEGLSEADGSQHSYPRREGRPSVSIGRALLLLFNNLSSYSNNSSQTNHRGRTLYLSFTHASTQTVLWLYFIA